jgi:peptidase MA superfamily protein/WD40 repeat protein
MKPPVRRRAALLSAGLALLVAAAPAAAQYDTVFGQNRVTYDKFRWQVYKAPHFDIYHYKESEPFLDDVISYSESAYVRISKELDHELRFRIPLVIYKTHGEFEGTHISLEDLPEAVGAFAEPVQNRMVLPIDQPPDKLYELITHELTHIFQYSMFFEGYLGRALRARIPTWLVEGMASYFAQDEETLDRMVIRDAVVNNIIPPVQQLDFLSYLNYRYGHAVFDYIEEEYGKDGVRNFIYEYRKVLLTGNVEKAVSEAFGTDIDAFNRNFNRFLRRRYFPVLLEKKSPDDYGKEIGIRRPGVFTFSPTLSPSGELIATFATPKQDLDLVVLSAEDGKTVKNLTKGWTNKYRYLVTEAFSGRRDLSWSPTGDQIVTFVRKENRRMLALYDGVKGKLLDMIPLPGVAQGASPVFSPDGQRIAFEGNKDGIVDLFELDLKANTIRNLTQDEDFDANPWYAPDGATILYNRRVGSTWKVFSVDLSDPTRKTQLTFGDSMDIQPSYSRDGKTVFLSSDRGGFGVFNIFSLDIATGETRQYTDVVGGCFDPVEMAPRDGEPYLVITAYFDGTFRLYRMPLRQSEAPPESAPAEPGAETTPFESPLKLTADRETIKPYKLRWDLEAPQISVGVTDDGTFLSNVALQFSDLLGDHRASLTFFSVSTYSNFILGYTNIKSRLQWGATVFDLRDYYLSTDGFNVDRRQAQKSTGGQIFASYPFNRYYRVQAGVGFTDTTQDLFVGYGTGGIPQFQEAKDQFIFFSPAIVGDTTRYQSFGPFQGKRFLLGFDYGMNLSSNPLDGDVEQVKLDFRAYKQLTRRSLLAFRLFGVLNEGDRQVFYGMGGLNDLRGYEYRDFYGSNVAQGNIELRFPLVDEVRFPIGPLRNIRGFFFLDAGTAWLPDDQFYDPDLDIVRAQPDPTGTFFTTIPFDVWDSENNRLQDLRASWGVGFQFFFLGGLQFNWAWAKRFPYTGFRDDPSTPFDLDFIPVKVDVGGFRNEFYIIFDW